MPRSASFLTSTSYCTMPSIGPRRTRYRARLVAAASSTINALPMLLSNMSRRSALLRSPNAPTCTYMPAADSAAGVGESGCRIDTCRVGRSPDGSSKLMASISTKLVPSRTMSSLSAATYDRSMMRLLTNGPRSLTRTITLLLLRKLRTRT